MVSISVLSLLFFLCFGCHSTCTSQYTNGDKNSGDNGNRAPYPGDSTSTSDSGSPVSTKSNQVAPFDTDIRGDCRDLLEYCQSHIFGHVYLQCPGLCTKFLQEEGMIGTAHENPDALYEAGSLRTYYKHEKGTGTGTVDADRFEGYVLVFAVVPLLPGMATYYQNMMEHLHGVFDPKVEFVILPMDLELRDKVHLPRDKEHSKVVVLEEEPAHAVTETHPWVKHLAAIKPRSGLGTNEYGDGTTVEQRPLQTDRVSVYIVSADGYYVEQLIAPSMSKLKERIRIYTKSIDYEL
eukprot:jgi/Psemu1/58559/gm1.58559_g